MHAQRGTPSSSLCGCAEHSAHCPKKNTNFCIKTDPATARVDETAILQFIWPMNQKLLLNLLYNPDRLGFYANFQIILGQCG